MDATDARLAAANRRKLLAQREQQFKRQQTKLNRELTHREVLFRRKESAKTGENPETIQEYYSAAGPGSSWRAREHVNLKNSPRNARRKSTVSENDDDEIEEIERLIQLTKKLHEEDGDFEASTNNTNSQVPSARRSPHHHTEQQQRKAAEEDNNNKNQQQLPKSDFKVEKKKKKEIKPISSALYQRFSHLRSKQSTAEAYDLY